MNIVMYTPNPDLAERWFGVLGANSSVFQAENLDDLLSLMESLEFNLLVLHDRDLPMGKVAQIRRDNKKCKIFILSDRPDDDKGLEYLRLGVVGFGNSYMTLDRLAAAVQVIAGGSVWVNQSLMQRLIVEAKPKNEEVAKTQVVVNKKEVTAPQSSKLLRILSKRELEIAKLVAEGLSNMEIAATLGIAERTVKTHLSTVFSKLGIRGRLNLAILVNKEGDT